MPSIRIPKHLNKAMYFLTFTVKNWYYVLDRYDRWMILSDSIKYFQDNKNLLIYSFMFMINHIHLIVQSDDISGFVRDFKKYTAKKIKQNLEMYEPDFLKMFMNEDMSYNFWMKTNMPKLIETENYFYNKFEYIHNNPVKRLYVENPEYWYWSSANPNCEIKVETIH